MTKSLFSIAGCTMGKLRNRAADKAASDQVRLRFFNKQGAKAKRAVAAAAKIALSQNELSNSANHCGREFVVVSAFGCAGMYKKLRLFISVNHP